MLSEFINIRSRLTIESICSNELSGIIKIDKQTLENIKLLEKESCVDDFVEVDGSNIPIESLDINSGYIRIKMYPKSIKEGLYYEKVEDLINSNKYSYPDLPFFIYELNYSSNNGQSNLVIENYKNTIVLIDFLKTVSDHFVEDEIFFFGTKKLTIKLKYSHEDLVTNSNYNELIKHILESVDIEERKIIFCNELISFASSFEADKCFINISKRFDDLFYNYKKSYSFYLEKYSYNKVKAELDNDIISYGTRIQSVINDIQTKLISIPIAFLLISAQFDLSGVKMMNNLLLIISSIIFSCLLEILLQNQFFTLKFVYQDVKMYKLRIDENKKKAINEDLDGLFNKIYRSYRKQNKLLHLIRFLIWTIPILTMVLFFISILNNTLFIVYLKLFLIISCNL